MAIASLWQVVQPRYLAVPDPRPRSSGPRFSGAPHRCSTNRAITPSVCERIGEVANIRAASLYCRVPSEDDLFIEH